MDERNIKIVKSLAPVALQQWIIAFDLSGIHLCHIIKYLAEWHQLYDEVVFELSYIGRMVRRNKLSRVLDLCINKIQ